MKIALLLSFFLAAVAIPHQGDSSLRPGGSSTSIISTPSASTFFSASASIPSASTFFNASISTSSASASFNASTSAPRFRHRQVKKMLFKGSPPARAHAIALDEATGEIVAYGTDGRYLGHFSPPAARAERRDGSLSNCRDATSDEFETIPGWNTFASAMTSFAEGQAPQTYYVNDQNYPSFWASVCYSTVVVSMQPDSSPSCSTQSSNVAGSSQGTTATLTAQLQTDDSASYTTTTEESSEFAWSDTISVHAGLEIASIDLEQTISLSLTNTHGSQDTSSQGGEDTRYVTWTDEPGESCEVQLNVTTCNFSAQNTIDFYLTGYIWASFKTWFRDPSCTSALAAVGGACANLSGKDLDNCYDNNQCKEHGHWTFTVESVVPNESDRSHPMTFTTALSTSSDTKYQLVCNPI